MAREQVLLAEQFQENLFGHPKALDWLCDRGLSLDTIANRGLGWTGNGGSKYSNSVVIPYYRQGKVLTLRYRSLEPGAQAKYRTHAGEKPHLYNVEAVRSHVVHLAEGEFDAMVLEQEGFAAVGVPGIQIFRPEWRWLFAGNDARIVFDSEKEGSETQKHVRNATDKIVRVLDTVAEKTDTIDLPEGHDVTSLYLQDREELLRCLSRFD